MNMKPHETLAIFLFLFLSQPSSSHGHGHIFFFFSIWMEAAYTQVQWTQIDLCTSHLFFIIMFQNLYFLNVLKAWMEFFCMCVHLSKSKALPIYHEYTFYFLNIQDISVYSHHLPTFLEEEWSTQLLACAQMERQRVSLFSWLFNPSFSIWRLNLLVCEAPAQIPGVLHFLLWELRQGESLFPHI